MLSTAIALCATFALQAGEQRQGSPLPQGFLPKPVPTLTDAQKKAIISKQLGGIKFNSIYLSEPIKLRPNNAVFQDKASFSVFYCKYYSVAANQAAFEGPDNAQDPDAPAAKVAWKAAKGKSYLVSFGLWRLHPHSDTWSVRWGPSPDNEWAYKQSIQADVKDPVISVVVTPAKSGLYSATLEPLTHSWYNVSYIELTPIG